MNISSAGDHDAIAGGGRTLYMLGISPTAFKEVVAADRAGVAPRAGARRGASATRRATPSIYDSAAASASEAVETALERKTKEAVQIAQDELTRSPDASGKARQVEFQGSQVPRLALMAYNRGAAEQQILRHYQRVHGMTPDATARWKSRYDLETTSEDWLAILEGAAKTNLSSPTLTLEALRGMAKDRGLDIADTVWKTIAAEFEAGRDAGDAGRGARRRSGCAVSDGAVKRLTARPRAPSRHPCGPRRARSTRLRPRPRASPRASRRPRPSP